MTVAVRTREALVMQSPYRVRFAAAYPVYVYPFNMVSKGCQPDLRFITKLQQRHKDRSTDDSHEVRPAGVLMILCMGLLKAIPDDLYEASAMDGAGPFQNFFKITLPLLIKPLTPLMIASFAFNFNNFVLIQLLTNGGPDRLGTTTPAGYTDLLVSYTYRIAFEGGGGQDFGLAAAIATLIFLLVGALAIVNLKATRMKFD